MKCELKATRRFRRMVRFCNCFWLIWLGFNNAILSVFTQPCSGGVELVIDSLRSDQFSASTFRDNYRPEDVRLSNGSGWVASIVDKIQYLKIELKGRWNITGVAVAASGYYGHHTREMRIFYSDDDLVWTPYTSHLSDEFLGERISTYERNPVKNVSLHPPIKARFIVFNPVHYYGYPALKLELYGCQLSNEQDTKHSMVDMDIETAQTWVPSQSPVVINKLIAVRPSGNLTIQAGVAVIFTSQDAGIDIFGNLTAIGFSGVPVVFNSNYPVLDARNRWTGLKKQPGGKLFLHEAIIRQATTGYSGGGSGLVIDTSVVHSCENGIQISDGAAENISSVLIKDTHVFLNRRGILLHGTKAAPYISIQGSNISNNDNNGIEVQNWDNAVSDTNKNTSLVIADCSFERNRQSGLVTLENLPFALHIENSTFKENSQYGIYFLRYNPNNIGQSVLKISQSYFRENLYEGIYVRSILGLGGPTHIGIYDSSFKENSRGAMYLDVGSDAGYNETMIDINNNTVLRHSYSNYPCEIHQRSNRFRVTIRNNSFQENRGALYVQGSDGQMKFVIINNKFQSITDVIKSVIKVSNALLEFTNNVIENATAATLIQIGSGYDHLITNNSFISDEDVSCFVNVMSPFKIDKVIEMRNNYWGTNSLQKIKEKICDFFFNIHVVRVQLKSIFVDPTLNAKTYIVPEDAFVQIHANESYVYGGILHNTLQRPQYTNNTIFVNRSIIIEGTGEMKFAGSHIIFAENRGIIVKGQLIFENDIDSANETILTSLEPNDRWGGLYLYGGHLSLAKTRITNVVKAITIKDTDSINVETTSVANVDYLIYADYLNRNLSISFQSSNLDLVRQAIFVTLNYTEDINIALFDTSVTGPGIDGILRIVDARGRPGDVLTTVDLHIENSTIDTEHRYSMFIYVESCQVHFNFVSSQNSFKTKSDNVYVHSQSVNFDVFGNQFLRGNQAFDLRFCEKSFEDDSRNRTINIHNNSFTLYSKSDVVHYSTYYSKEHVHTFNIHGNVFKQSKFGYGHGFYYDSNTYAYIGLDIHITNNLFEGYSTSINIYGWANNVSITGNTFFNNSEVLVLDQYENYAENVSFSSNIIQGNHDRVKNAAGGLLQLKPYRGDSVVRIELIGNVFENNTKTLITTPSPNVLIRHNVLANRNAIYSLELLKDPGYTIANNEVLNASLNYWGSKDVKTIASKIYDNDYDHALFDVVFRPYLGSRNISDIQNKEAGFIGQNGEIGGSLNENITLTADGSPYMVMNNIEVEEQGVLVLEAGVTLLFKASQGMSVIGTLTAFGNDSHPVQLLPRTAGEKWRGLDFKRGSGKCCRARTKDDALCVLSVLLCALLVIILYLLCAFDMLSKLQSGARSSVLRHLSVNDTLHGITIKDHLSEISNVVSSFSQEHGFIFNILKSDTTSSKDDSKKSKNVSISDYSNAGNKLSSEMKITSLTAANNTKSGVVVQINRKAAEMIDFIIGSCNLFGNAEHGVDSLANASVTLSSCDIFDNHKSGVHVDQHSGGRTNIVNTTLSLNREYAINSVRANEIVLDSCEITNHNYGYHHYWYGWRTREYIRFSMNSYTDMTVIVRGNRFLHNVADGIHFDLRWSNRVKYNVTIENNLFENGNRTLVISDSTYDYTNNENIISMNNNTFKNLSSIKSEIMRFDLRTSSELVIEHNHITDVTALNIIVIEGERVIRRNSITISDNVISDNVVQDTVSLTSYQNNISLAGNILDNPGSECELKLPGFLKSSYSVNARFNYWGTENGSEVVRKVCGYDKDMTTSYVYYIPYYLNGELQLTMSQGQVSFSVAGALGGEIVENLILTKHNSPYRISRSLMIRYNATLTLEAGVTLNFEKNRGIYVDGTLMVLGSSNDTVKLHGIADEPWHGIVLDSMQYASSFLSSSDISNTNTGIIARSPHFVITASNITESSTTGLSVALREGDPMVYDFAGTNIENTLGKGVVLNGNGILLLENLTIRNASTQGIYLAAVKGSLTLSNIVVQNCSTAVDVLFQQSNVAGNVTMVNCKILNNSNGVLLKTENNDGENLIKLTNNYFFNNKGMTLDILAPYYEAWHAYDYNQTREVDVGYNTFENCSDIRLQTYDLTNLYFHDNTVINGMKETKNNKCILDVNTRGNRELPGRTTDISTNIFEGNHGDCVLSLMAFDYKFNGRVFYNQFVNNRVEETVVTIDTYHFRLSENIFDNPGSQYDLCMTKDNYTPRHGTVDATHNWWGSANFDFANLRVFDYNDDKSLMLVNITPILTNQKFACEAVKNCSGNGECVRPNGCRCFSGWAGPECTDYNCAEVGNCYGNGNCTGPNVCQCDGGWTGDRCLYATCINVNNCSEHGVCVGPDVCTCAADFTGSTCDSCIPYHWGPECKLCPACEHGVCNLDTGLCICDSKNWAGYLCDRCNETFYGPDCLPLMMALNIIPNQGLDQGNTHVHVWGHNFPETLDKHYFCKFGNIIVNGTWESWNHIVCTSPAHLEGDVILKVSPNVTDYTSNKLIYTYYATCPPGACGRDLSPLRGQCLFGRCSCNLPWTGDGCTVELIAPVIEPPRYVTTVTEFSAYTVQLVLKTGSTPVRWTLIQSPSDMTINTSTGLVDWPNPKAISDQCVIQAKASNMIGSDIVTWNILVHRSYSVVVLRVEPNGRLPVPKIITIFGDVIFNNGSSLRTVPIAVRIKSVYNGHVTSISELSSPLQSTWSTIYIPRADDVGIFEAYAFHPAATASDVRVTWSVAGMRCEPDSLNAEEVIEDQTVIFKNISVLRNVGGTDLPAITSEISGLGGAFVRQNGIGQNESSQPFISSLNADEEISFDLLITEARPLSGTIFVYFTTSEGTRTSLRVRIKLTIRRPLLIFNPSSLSENVNRDSQRIFDVELRNEGEVAATNVRADLPVDPRLSLISFSNTNQTSKENHELILLPREWSIMSLAITPGNSLLGEMGGTIAVNSDLASATLRYKFYITSIQKLNMTFFVKDEYTYFASGAPLVSGAEVRLTNPRRGYSETKYTTNETGYVVFENITEDQYTLYARADGHSSYSAVITANPVDIMRDIFLQRVAVKYTWTVTPTTIQDKYVITLDSTFETSVQMPVVTIEPAKVNTIPYELGQADTIDFEITNHGLIRADHLRFVLPTSHPYLIFESIIETIGSIDANTTLIVPVRTVLKKVTKRSIASRSVCGLALLYDYECGGTQTRSLDVTLTREYPGRPPLPCKRRRWTVPDTEISVVWPDPPEGRIYDPHYGPNLVRAYKMTYNPVTPLSCDCAKTLVKSCALAFKPIAGCVVAITGLEFKTMVESCANALFPKAGCVLAARGLFTCHSFLGCVFGVLDTAFSCVIGVLCKPCGLLYTALRCLLDLWLNCHSGSRRRREISASVSDNALQTAPPVANFLMMMTDIYNDDAMYNINETWYESFKTAMADDSDAGTLLTNDETNLILNNFNDNGSRATLSKFLTRWNNTVAAWKNGTLSQMKNSSLVIPMNKLTPRIEQYVKDVKSSKQRGYASIFEEYIHATKAYKDAEKQEQGSGKEEGICAKVRVRIVQELVLTRDAFNARLEMENGENSDLENIKVEIIITQTYGTGDPANGVFSIGQPSLIGISAVDGTGRLGKDLSGSAEWLMIPYSHAAPQDDTQYDVGGLLSYSVGGSDFSVPLLPDTITVKPNPSLVVHYFHEKYVRGDDPMTPEVEPIVPFTLAVMVMNAGYGVARALKISSAQPEIIENEKGLLIAFEIIGSQIGNQPMSPSMTVNFGDIGSFETKTARWLLTSTLQGIFYNYSATFENINPLGDPQLSLMDELGYHELVHVVQINDGPDGANTVDDGLGDFLVNDRVDQNGIPEFLYDSANGSDVQPVLYANVSGFNLIEIFSRGSKTYKVVELIAIVNTSSWSYSRVINNITSTSPADNEILLQVVRADEKFILVEKNAWQTTRILDMFLYHMLDYIPESENETIVTNYNLTFGPRNMYPPKFNTSSFSGSISLNAQENTFVLKLAAHDIDKDEIHFRLANKTFSLFSVTTFGEIEVNEPLKEEGQVNFEVIVEDSGIPSKSTSASVSVTITGPEGTWTTSSYTPSGSDATTSGNVPGVTTSSIKTTTSSANTAVVLASTSFIATITESTTSTRVTSTDSALSPTVTLTSTSVIANITESTTSTRMTSTDSVLSPTITPVSSTIQPDFTENNVTKSALHTTDKSTTSTMSSIHTPTISSTVMTTPRSATKDTEGTRTPSWVLPTVIGAGIFVVLLIFVAVLIFALRRNESH